MVKTPRIAAFFVALVFASAGVLAQSPDPIRIGVCLTLSGENSEWGKRTLAGVQLRQEEWNNSGATPAVRLVIRDDKADAELSRQHVADLVENERVAVIIGPGRPRSLQGVREYLRERQIVAISPNATHPDIGKGDDWIFRLLFDDDFQAGAIAQHAYENLHLRRAAAVLNTFYAYPEIVFRAFRERFEALGGKIVDVKRFSWKYDEEDVFDFASTIYSLIAAAPDVIFLPLLTPEVIEAMNASAGISLNAVFCGTHTWISKELLESGGNALVKAPYVSGFNLEADTPAMRHFQSQYDDSNVPYLELESVFGYDTLSLILHGFKDGVSSEALRENLYSLRNFHLASGPITITREHSTQRPAYIHHIIKEKGGFKSTCVSTIYPEVDF